MQRSLEDKEQAKKGTPVFYMPPFIPAVFSEVTTSLILYFDVLLSINVNLLEGGKLERQMDMLLVFPQN